MTRIKVHDKYFVPFITETQISEKIAGLASLINRDYEGKNLLVLSVLNGSFIFTADLVRQLTIPAEVQFLRISTYGNTMESSENAREVWGLQNLTLKDRAVLIVEDIIDSGYTLSFLYDVLEKLQPASLTVATLLFKPAAFKGTHRPDYTGFEIPNAFVVGYGMDYAQQGRELKAIYQLSE